MRNIRLLDCTLRDGGYCNNWEFGFDNIQGIINGLLDSNIDIIECGFFSGKVQSNQEVSRYKTFDDIAKILPKNTEKTFACMINYGEYNIDDIPQRDNQPIGTFRVAFHKKDMHDAVEFCKKLKTKGYDVFLQPMVTQNYSDNEFLELIHLSNEITPFAFYIVDSFGVMTQQDVVRFYNLADNNLDKNIPIGFHSHNNLQLSFSNSVALLDMKSNRDIIIDSSVYGMGRGAGNLCTELMAKYLNDNYNAHYDIVSILEVLDDYINPIFKKMPWGYSVAYYVAAVNNCHPNYATYLVDKQTVSVKTINIILSQLPEQNKKKYDKNIIEDLYLKNLSRDINDTETINYLRQLLGSKKILILAPGKSLTNCYSDICNFIEKEKPIVIAVNFVPKQFAVDALFVSNLKRFSELTELQYVKDVILTSNLSATGSNVRIVNYSSLISPNTTETDNAGMMVLRLLKKLGINNVNIAGFDGYKMNIYENYYSNTMILEETAEVISNRNKSISEQLLSIGNNLKINFLTPSLYSK